MGEKWREFQGREYIIDFFQELLDSYSGAVCAIDSEGRFTYLNAAACELFGYSARESLLGVSFEVVVDAERSRLPKAAVTERIVQVARSGEPLRDYSAVWLRARQGNSFPVIIDAAPLHGGTTTGDSVVVNLRDGTQRREREAELRRTQERLKETQEEVKRLRQRQLELAEAQRMAQIGVWSWDLRSGYRENSTESYRIFGATAVALDPSKKGFFDTVHPDDRARVEAEFDAISRYSQQWKSEFRIVRFSGEVRTLSEQGQVELDESGQPRRIIGTVQDITEQRRREDFQKQLIAILDNTPDIVSLHDTDGRLIYFNAAGRKRFGLPNLPRMGDAESQAYLNLPAYPSVEEAIRCFHPQWAVELLLNEGVPTAQREGLWQGETAIIDADLKEVATSQVIIGHRDAAGKVVQLSTIMRDISDFKQAQRELADRERRFRLIADNVSDVFWLRTAHRLLYVNSAYERVWGKSAEQFYAEFNGSVGDVHPRFLDDVHPDDREALVATLKQGIAAHEELDLRYRIIRPDGDVRWIHARSFPVSGLEHEDVRAGIARDITYEVLAAERTKQLAATVSDLSELKRVQQEAVESEKHFRLVAESISDAFWLRTAERTLYVNPACEQIWGQPKERLYADPQCFLESVHPEDRQWLEAALARANAAHKKLDALYRIIRPDGAVRWIHTHSHAVGTSDEGEKMRADIARDVTQCGWVRRDSGGEG